jgi:hypothetical protein
MTGALPYRITFDRNHPRIEWLWADGSRFTEPFFEETLARLRRNNPANRRTSRPSTPLAALRDFPSGVPPAAFIFHVSRCGSTLVAQMLAALERNVVASEPQIIDDILRTSQHDPAVTDDDRIALLRGAVNALSQPPHTGADRIFLKLDCWHLFSLPLFRKAYPAVPCLFVYRDPLEVLVSLMRRPSLTLVRGTVTPEQLGLTAAERDSLLPHEHAAAILGAFYRAANRYSTSVVPIAYDQLPSAVVNVIPGCSFTPDEQARLLAAAEFNAKTPGERFVPDALRKRQEADAALIAAVKQWAEPAYVEWLASIGAPQVAGRK